MRNRSQFPTRAALNLAATFAVLITGLFARLSLTGEVLPPDVVMATYMVNEFSSFLRAVVVLGHPTYYPRFGFGPASGFGLQCEFDVPDEAFMVVEREPGHLGVRGGWVRFHPAFASDQEAGPATAPSPEAGPTS